MVSTGASCCNTLSLCFCLSLVTWIVVIREDISTLEVWMALSEWHSYFFFFCLCVSSHSHDIRIKARRLLGNNDQSTHSCLFPVSFSVSLSLCFACRHAPLIPLNVTPSLSLRHCSHTAHLSVPVQFEISGYYWQQV